MSKELDVRVLEMEHVLTRLVTIQEEQTKQTDKIINSVDKFAAMSLLVEQNTQDIGTLRNRINEVSKKVYNEKEKVEHQIAQSKLELEEAGQKRFWKSLTASVTIIIFLFGYLYSDIKMLLKKSEVVVIKQVQLADRLDHFTNNFRKINNIPDYHQGVRKQNGFPK